MRLRLLYDLVIDSGHPDGCMTPEEHERLQELRNALGPRRITTDDIGGGGAPVTGNRSAFVVGNNNTVVINLVVPPAEEGGAS